MTKNKLERPSLGATLKKKVELGKSIKEIENVEEQIKELHAEETNIPKDSTKPKTPAKSKGAIESVAEEELIRTTIFLPKELHKVIKVYCVQQDNLKIKDFVTKTLVDKCKKLKLI